MTDRLESPNVLQARSASPDVEAKELVHLMESGQKTSCWGPKSSSQMPLISKGLPRGQFLWGQLGGITQCCLDVVGRSLSCFLDLIVNRTVIAVLPLLQFDIIVYVGVRGRCPQNTHESSFLVGH